MSEIITQLCTTVQGEGPTVGMTCLLIRLANCNLNCNFCDTKWTNNLKLNKTPNLKSINDPLPIKIDTKKEMNTFIKMCQSHISNYNIDRILITGGEPFLNSRLLRNLILELYSSLNITNFEIETNGTLLREEFFTKINVPLNIQLNISPKLDPTYYKDEKIKNINDIIKLHKRKYELIANLIEYDLSLWANYKFVYYKEIEKDLDEFISKIKITLPIVIIPLTPDYTKYKSEFKFLKDYRLSCYEAIDYCLRKNYMFSPRLHIWVFNNFKHRNEFEDCRFKYT